MHSFSESLWVFYFILFYLTWIKLSMGHPTPFCLTTTSAVLLSCECSIHANACSFSLSCLSLMQSGLSCDSSSFINTLPDMYININMFLHYHTCNLLHLAQKSIIQFPSFFWKQPHYLLWSNSYWIVTEIRKKKTLTVYSICSLSKICKKVGRNQEGGREMWEKPWLVRYEKTVCGRAGG